MALEPRPLDIVVGGAGDRWFGCARRYAENLAQRHPSREIVYLTQGRRQALSSLVSKSRAVNLIGHSWGAADVSWVVARADRQLGAVIGIDPVGKPGLWKDCGPINARALVTVFGTGSEGRLSDGNLTAKVGRKIGHPCPPAFVVDSRVHIEAPYAHYDMTRMMRHVGPDGRSAEDWLLEL